jgi:hypothetical protein
MSYNAMYVNKGSPEPSLWIHVSCHLKYNLIMKKLEFLLRCSALYSGHSVRRVNSKIGG